MSRRSIRFQLTAWYGAVLAAILCVAGVGAWFALRETIHDAADKDLRVRLRAVRNYLQSDMPGGVLRNLAEELDERSAIDPGGALLAIGDEAGNWIYRSPGVRKWPLEPPRLDRLPARGKARTVFIGAEPMRVMAAPASAGGRKYAVQVASPLGEYYEMLDEFGWTALWASPIILLLASAGGYWMSRRALAPVDRVIRTARAIGAQSLSERLPVGGTADEIDRLSDTLNAMFARLEAAFRRITQFTADASHELRTPVSIIRTTAELARRKPRSEAEYEKALDGILAESERTTRLIEDLLSLARADAGGDALAMERIDLAECAQEACAAVRVLAEAKQLSFGADLFETCLVSGDYQALRRMLLILLDNAVKYTAPGGAVRVSIARADGFAEVAVRDTGMGISPEDLPHIFERFYRADPGRSRDSGGAGLGLSIAQWIANRHGGEIVAESAPSTGSLFRVRLPDRG